MAKLNRIRVVLAKRDLNNKWHPTNSIRIRPLYPSGSLSLEALIAIANALEAPVHELVRQEEFSHVK